MRLSNAVLTIVFFCHASYLIGSEAGAPGATMSVMWIANVDGPASLQPSGMEKDEDWIPAERNRRIVVGDRISTVGKATVQIQTEDGSVTLPADTTVLVQRSDDQAVLFKLEQGGLNLKVDQLPRGRDFSVATGNLSLELKQPGQYRFDTDSSGNVRTVSVDRGECVAAWDSDHSFSVGAGQQATVSGVTYTLNPPTPPEAQPEEHAENPTLAPGTTPMPGSDGSGNGGGNGPLLGSEMAPGTDQLSGYGDWSPSPSGAMAWYPRVAVGWAPYTVGHWQWIDPEGWTWIDQAAWGFTPFHYGRWGQSARGWYWIPGGRSYSPALVAWVSRPGSTDVAWIPLGPGEFAGVGFGVSRYMNRGHLAAISRETFVGASAVGPARLHVSAAAYQTATVGGYVAIRPERASILGSARAVVHPPIYVTNRTAFTRVAPGSLPLSFERRQAIWAQSPGRPIQSAFLADQTRGNSAFRVGRGSLTPSRPGINQPTPQTVQRPYQRPYERPYQRPAFPPAQNPPPGRTPPPRPGTPAPAQRPAPPPPQRRTPPPPRPATHK